MEPDASRKLTHSAKGMTDSALLHRSLHEPPHSVTHASGIKLYLGDGRTIIDACGGAAVAILGHGNQEVVVAAAKQMGQVSYVHTGAYTTESAEDLARILLDGNPYGLEKALFVGSGKLWLQFPSHHSYLSRYEPILLSYPLLVEITTISLNTLATH